MLHIIYCVVHIISTIFKLCSTTEQMLPLVFSSNSKGKIFKNVRPGSNPTKTNFPNFTHICKIFLQICEISDKLVKNEYYQIFMNVCKPNLAYFESIL
jgi:hypothetical protein